MKTPVIATKLFIPAIRPGAILRPQLLVRLNEGRQKKLTLVSAPAGYGKTTLVSQWIADVGLPAAWLSLDREDNGLTRFLIGLVSSLSAIPIGFSGRFTSMLESPQPPSAEYILEIVLNGIAIFPDHFFLVLDDYHVVNSKPVNDALAFLLDRLPRQMHLVIVTREDPLLPLARLRAGNQLTELRAADLRFSPSEAAAFLNLTMGLSLSVHEIADLDRRTEGWITGLHLAAVSMQGQDDSAGFIRAFTGSHRFVLDYLMEEVLQNLPENMRSFLLGTSILDRLCGPLCDALLSDPTVSGQRMLEELDRANLFIVPLDSERQWFRYHHLFSELLRQQLRQSADKDSVEGAEEQYHLRASKWYEDNGFQMSAFHHAAAAHDIPRAERLMESEGMPITQGGGAAIVLDWLQSLPASAMDPRPRLWVRWATLLLASGQATGVEEKLQAAEAAIAALQTAESDSCIRDLLGQIACARAILAFTRYDADTIFRQAERALEYLTPGDRPFSFTAHWMIGMACLFEGDRARARRAILEALSLAKASGDIHNIILAETSLGQIREMDNQLYQAEETYRHIVLLLDECPLPVAGEAYRGLAQICYERNELNEAESYGQRSLILARGYDQTIDRFVVSKVFLAKIKLARGDRDGAAEMLAETEKSVRRRAFERRMPEVAAAQVLVLLSQSNYRAAASLADIHHLPMSRARVYLAEGNAQEALRLLKSLRERSTRMGWQDEQLKTTVLEAVCRYALGERSEAVELIDRTLVVAEPEGFVRLFVDEGARMALLLKDAAGTSKVPAYVSKLLAAFQDELIAGKNKPVAADAPEIQPVYEPLSPRELEVLRLIAGGLSNQDIGERLFLALDTVKGHNRRIFEKLRVQRRTEAVARARELGLI